MAEVYDALYVLRNVDYAIDKYINLCKDFSLDGAILHSNRSCKGMAFKQFEIVRQLKSRLGVPAVLFDGDQTDPSVFSQAQYETRVQALMEMMEERKALGGRQ
jgi:benzoyl-CoA reductase/2-hydroxyglutaryl-CoA dehydratase subunit BcrC/BadD/HgdB